MSQAVSSPVKSAAGLEGVVAAPSEICFIDGSAGRLVYRGYDIGDLVENATFEETAFLLWESKLPNRSELSRLKSELSTNAALPDHTLAVLKSLPASTEPMDALRTAASSLSSIDPDLQSNEPAANLRKAIRLTAQFPTIVAAFHRLRHDQKPIEPQPNLSIAANFLYMLTGNKPHETLVRVLDAALVLHAEHGFNASTFAARVTAATLADMHAGVTAAVSALKGPLHGGANQEVMQLLLECGDAETAVKKVREMLSDGEKIPGFGHRVYKTFDPRGDIPAKDEQTTRRSRRQHQVVRNVRTAHPHRQRDEEQGPQRRFLQRQRLLHDGHSDRSLHSDLRHRPHRRLDRPYHGTAQQQPNHPPAG